MRATTAGKRVLQALTPILLGTLAPSALAQGPTHPAQHWICQYTVGGEGMWYMRCDNLASLDEDDPALHDDPRTPTTRYIPLWGPPYDDSRSPDLARTLLCSQGNACSVVLASRR